VPSAVLPRLVVTVHLALPEASSLGQVVVITTVALRRRSGPKLATIRSSSLALLTLVGSSRSRRSHTHRIPARC